MVRFYDPVDNAEQHRVERLLRRGGIEYLLGDTTGPGSGGREILVAEEDLPEAERLLSETRH